MIRIRHVASSREIAGSDEILKKNTRNDKHTRDTYPSSVLHLSTRQALVKLDSGQWSSREWQEQRGVHHQMLQVGRLHLTLGRKSTIKLPKNTVWQILTSAQQKGDENNEINSSFVNTNDSVVRNRTFNHRNRQTALCTHLNYKQNKFFTISPLFDGIRLQTCPRKFHLPVKQDKLVLRVKRVRLVDQ